MYTLASDEKASGVMIYTQNSLVTGELVTKQNNRISVLLRTAGAPDYMHLLKPQVINMSGDTTRTLNYSEMFFPTALVIGFHMTPPAQDPLDYDDTETNRTMQPIAGLVGTFVLNGAIRIPTQVDLGTSISAGRAIWLSIYNANISNPQLPLMGELLVPMLLVRNGCVSFGMSDELSLVTDEQK